MHPITLDLETTIHNKGNPHDTRNWIVTANIRDSDAKARCVFFDYPDFKTQINQALRSGVMLIGVNIKFDLSHLVRAGFVLPAGLRVWDCMVAEFILSGQSNSFASLSSLAERYKLPEKNIDINSFWEKGISTENIPRDIVEERGVSDVELTYQVYQCQLKDERMTPELHRLIVLSGIDLLGLVHIECSGFKYDSAASLRKAADLQAKLEEMEAELMSFSEHKFNPDSGDELSCFLYGGTVTEDVYEQVDKVYKSGPRKGEEYTQNQFKYSFTKTFPGYFKPLRGTAIKKSTDEAPLYQTSDDVLQRLSQRSKRQQRIVELLRTRSKLEKLVGTYLKAIPTLMETMHWGEYVHGQFNQVVARTGRLSSSKPNMQNASPEVDQFYVSRYDG